MSNPAKTHVWCIKVHEVVYEFVTLSAAQAFRRANGMTTDTCPIWRRDYTRGA